MRSSDKVVIMKKVLSSSFTCFSLIAACGQVSASTVDKWYQDLHRPEYRNIILRECARGRALNRMNTASRDASGKNAATKGAIVLDDRGLVTGPDELGRIFDAMTAIMYKVCPDVW